jgi:hypothetical protein
VPSFRSTIRYQTYGRMNLPLETQCWRQLRGINIGLYLFTKYNKQNLLLILHYLFVLCIFFFVFNKSTCKSNNLYIFSLRWISKDCLRRCYFWRFFHSIKFPYAPNITIAISAQSVLIPESSIFYFLCDLSSV